MGLKNPLVTNERLARHQKQSDPLFMLAVLAVVSHAFHFRYDVLRSC